MLECFRRKVYFEDTLKEYYSNIIASFTQYYGNDMSDIINKKLSNVALAGFYPITQMQSNCYSLRNAKAKELMTEFVEEIADYLGDYKSQFERWIFDWPYLNCFHYSDRPHPFEAIINDLNKDLKISNYLKVIYKINDNDYLQKKNNHEFDFLIEKILPIFERYKKDYIDYCNIFSWISEYTQKCLEVNKQNKEEIEFEYIKDFLINDCKPLIPPEDYEKIMMADNLSQLNHCNLSQFVTIVLGVDFEQAAYIDYFLYVFDNDEEILKKRINLLNNLGYNFGENYSDYVNDSNCSKAVDMLKMLAEIKQSVKLDCEREICSLKAETQTIVNQLNTKKLKFTKYDQYAINCVLNKDVTAGSITFDVSTNDDEICPIFCLNLGSLLTVDETLIHELNHVLEMNVISKNEKDEYTYACGWQHGLRSFEKCILDPQYKMINEVINELISQDIIQIMRENNGCIFEPKSENIDYVSAYNIGFIIIKDFFEKYKESIIQSRLNNDLNIIYDVVGKENFEELNELLVSFCNTFNLSDLDLNGNIVVENNYKRLSYEAFTSKRDNILIKMYEYSSNLHR